jgi:hypothetical protein
MAAGIAWSFSITTLLFVPTVSPQRVIQGDRPARVETDLATSVSMILLSVTFVLVAIALLGIVQCARSREVRLLQLGTITMSLTWLLIPLAWPVFIVGVVISGIGNAKGRVLSTLGLALLLSGSIGGVLMFLWEEPLERFTGMADPVYLLAALFGVAWIVIGRNLAALSRPTDPSPGYTWPDPDIRVTPPNLDQEWVDRPGGNWTGNVSRGRKGATR